MVTKSKLLCFIWIWLWRCLFHSYLMEIVPMMNFRPFFSSSTMIGIVSRVSNTLMAERNAVKCKIEPYIHIQRLKHRSTRAAHTPRWLLWQFININEQYSNSDYNEIEIETGTKKRQKKRSNSNRSPSPKHYYYCWLQTKAGNRVLNNFHVHGTILLKIQFKMIIIMRTIYNIRNNFVVWGAAQVSNSKLFLWVQCCLYICACCLYKQ